MYGTIARVKIDPSRLEELKALGQRMRVAPGQITRYVYQMDADPGEIFLVAVFESKEQTGRTPTARNSISASRSSAPFFLKIPSGTTV